MSQNSSTGFYDVKPADPSFLARWEEERRLCAIIESNQSSPEQKYDALIQIAYISGIFVTGGLANAA